MGTGLQEALQTGNHKIAKYLVTKGSDPYIVNEQKKQVISYCQDPELAKELEKKSKQLLIFRVQSQKPPKVQGKIWKTGRIFKYLKERYMVIDVVGRNLLRYANKMEVGKRAKETIALKNIESLEEITKSGFLYHSRYHYFRIVYNGGYKITMATNSKFKFKKWINYLQDSIKYAKDFEDAIRERLLQGLEANVEDDNEPIVIDMDDPESFRQAGQIPDHKKLDSEKRINIKRNKERTFKYNVNLSSFELVKFLGRGAFGRVYKVIKIL